MYPILRDLLELLKLPLKKFPYVSDKFLHNLLNFYPQCVKNKPIQRPADPRNHLSPSKISR